MDKQTIRVIAIFAILSIAIGVIPIALSYQKVKVELLDDKIKIRGQYGRSIDQSNVKEVTLLAKLPQLTKRKRAISIDGIRKGLYVTAEGEEVYIYLDQKRNSSIIEIVELDGVKTYFSIQSKEENQNLYNQVKSQMGH